MIDPKKCRLMDKSFKYVRSEATNVAITFERIRRQMAEKHVTNVQPLRKGKCNG